MAIEDEHPDVLQNIEFAVTSLYRRNPEMSDYDVIQGYETLIRIYKAESAGRQSMPSNSSGLEADFIREVRLMCEWRLGRSPMSEDNVLVTCPKPIDVATLLLCLKRLLKSAQKWNKHGGRRGYLDFIVRFVK